MFLKLLRSIYKSRVVWFLIGASMVPAYYAARYVLFPTPKDAMDFFVSYYKESHTQLILGDYNYSLTFTGDKESFLRFVKRLGLQEYKVSETEYSKIEGGISVTFDESASLENIQYYSFQN